MAGEIAFAQPAKRELDESWSPSLRARSWLMAGIAALMIDFLLGIATTALELQHWAKEGFTPDVVVGYLSLVPQACIFLAWLVVAREAADRGLWKATAGLFGSYLLASLVSVALIDGVPRGWVIGINVATAIGIVALLTFSLSKRPRFDPPTSPPEEDLVSTAPTEEEGSTWGIHVVVAFGLFAAKMFIRRMNRGLPNIDLGLDGWSLLLAAVVLLFGIGYLVWAAVAKIRLRHKLGGLAAVVGGWELLAMLLHVGMLAGGIYLLVSGAIANPQLDDGDIDKLLDPWLMRATVVSAACHGLWIILAGALFTSLWLRPDADWQTSFAADAAGARFSA